MQKYEVNDTVLYAGNGVCRISAIEDRPLGGKVIRYYVLEPFSDPNTTHFVPVDNEAAVSRMTKILSSAEIYTMIDEFPKGDDVWVEDDSERRERAKAILAVGDRTGLVWIIKSFWAKQQTLREIGRKLQSADEKILQEAEKRLYREFSHVLNISQEEVIPLISNQIEVTRKKELMASSPLKAGDSVVMSLGGVWKVTSRGPEGIRFAECNGGGETVLKEDDPQIVRKTLSKDEMNTVISKINYITTFKAPNNKARQELLETAMLKCDCVEWVKIIKTVYQRGLDKKLLSWEEEIADKAKSNLYSEISVSLGIPLREVETYIASTVESSQW